MRFTLTLSFLTCLFMGGDLLAQTQTQAVLKPSLGVSIPVKEQDGKVVLSSSVLLNMNDLLPAGTTMHKLFPKPRKDDKDVRDRKIKNFNADQLAVRQRMAIENREANPDKTAVMKAAEARAGGEAIDNEMKFRAALHRMNIEEYYLAYDVPDSSERRIGQFDYPEGLFLGEQNGKVVVLGVAIDSVAEKIGVEAGSSVTALNARPLKSLEDFRDRYFKEKEQKKTAGTPMLMTLLLPGEKEPKEMEFEVKRSLGNAHDLMSDLDGDMSKKKTVTPAPEKMAPLKEVPSEEDSMNIPLIP